MQPAGNGDWNWSLYWIGFAVGAGLGTGVIGVTVYAGFGG
jgi:hypothetical protein